MPIQGILINASKKIFKKMHAFSNVRNIKVNLTSSLFLSIDRPLWKIKRVSKL